MSRFIVFLVFACSTAAWAEEKRFADQVGSVSIGEVDASTTIQVPCITWGGESALFAANGGLKTTPDSIYGKMGLKLNIVKQDVEIEELSIRSIL